MKSNEFLSSLGDIESNFIKEAAAVEQASSRRHGRIIAAAAAALALLAGGAVLLGTLGQKNKGANYSVHAEPTAQADLTSEATQWPDATFILLPAGNEGLISDANSSEEIGSDYLIFNGSYYEKMADMDNAALAGAAIGEVTKLVNSNVYFGRSEDDAVSEGNADAEPLSFEEHTGSMLGTIYAVQDYPTDYIVCQKTDNGVRVYFGKYGREFNYGGDILENCFGVSRRFAGLEYMREQHYDSTTGDYSQYYEPIDPELYGDVITAFTDALKNAEYRYEPDEFPNGVSTSDRIAYLRIMLNGGMCVNVVLYDGGHAWIYGSDGYLANGVLCVDKTVAEGLAELVRNKLVFTGSPKPTAFAYEDAVNDPWLGSAVPKRLPDGFDAVNVRLFKCSYYELEHSDRLPESSEGDPTGYLFLIVRPNEGDRLFDIHIDVFNSDEEKYFIDYGGVLNEFVPLEEFGADDIRVFLNDPDSPVYGAFVRVGNASVKITVGVMKEDAAAAQKVLMELVDSISK